MRYSFERTLFHWVNVLTIGFLLSLCIQPVTAQTAPVAAASNATISADWALPADVLPLSNADRSTPLDRNEVIEFFWYGCPHCADFQPDFVAWQTQQKSINLRVIPIPVSWNDVMVVHQRLYYTLKQLNRLDLHSQMFTDVAADSDELTTLTSQLRWAQAHNISAKKWLAAYRSTAVDKQVQQAQSLFERFELSGVPTIVVNRRYQILPHEGMLKSVDELLLHRPYKAPDGSVEKRGVVAP